MGEISPKCLKKFVRIAERCLHDTPELRPTMAEVVFSLESTLVFQEKFNCTSQPAGITIFGIRVNLFPFPSNGENSVQGDSKLSSNSKVKTRTNNSDSKIKVARAYLQSQSASVKEFTFDDLEKATRWFSPHLLLGEGRFGQVFLGCVDQKMFANNSKHGDGTNVAVKRLDHYYDWTAEVNILGQFAHPNIIRLLGYCRHKDGNMLVYEYMPKKSFANLLFTDGPHISEPLSWGKRLSIMIGVAHGLTYLHSAKLMCRSIKPSNILLDEDFNAKLAGFEKYDDEDNETLARPANYYTDNYYISNDYYSYAGDVSEKTNIYSFSVTLLESMAGRRAGGYNRTETDRLVEWERMIKSDSRNVKKIIDPRLEQNYPLQGAFECSVLALRCVAKEPKDRPSSEELLQRLELLYAQWMENSRHNVT